jgi:hypothetical protein
MRYIALLLLAPSLLPVSALAQPVAGAGDIWAADSNGDGKITRQELIDWMNQRFTLLDRRGDGHIPVEAMQRMLGQDRPPAATGADGARAAGQGRGRRHEGMGGDDGDSGGARMPHGGMGGRGGIGGGHGGGRSARPPGTAGNAAPPPPGQLIPPPEDSNEDGMIDRAEFLAPALALFDDRDRNGDGVLTPDELPPRPTPAN